MARIGIAGFLHETNTFAHSRASLNDFIQADAWPGVLQAEDLLNGLAGLNIPSAGFIAALNESDQAVPLLWASANPSGPVTEQAYETIWQWFEKNLRAAGQLDALFLDLHGAMVAEHLDDGEGEWLTRVRAIVGAQMPIIVTLDFHANVTPRMVDLSDVMLIYRSYPHIDMAATGTRAAQLLPRLLRGERWHKQWLPWPFLIPLPWQSTLTEPMQTIMQWVAATAPGVVTQEFAAGFPLADVYDVGPSLLVYSELGQSNHAPQLAQKIAALRHLFAGKLYTPMQAIALLRAHRDDKPLVLAETQDNPGGGGDGDGVAMVHALQQAGIRHACVALICDPVFAARAQAAGIGATLDGPLGALHNHDSGPPLKGPFIVRALSDGKFTGSGPFYGGCRMDLGPMARVEYHGLQLLISSRNQQAADQAMLRVLGIEPATQRVLVLKSSVHFRADFAPLSGAIYLLATPGANTADLRQLHYKKCRPGVELL